MLQILDRINSPSDLKGLTRSELAHLAAEIREKMVKIISANGGHLASSLGVVELTIALHRVFDSPCDKIIWDVGHQCYAHKLLTGRREKFDTIRQYGGLSGFPDPAESPHDAFATGHSGTSISAALGMALARDMSRDEYQVIAVIGDGSLGAGMAFEAVNHAGHAGTKLIVVLNDNGVAISPIVGSLARILTRVRFDARYEHYKQRLKRAVKHLPLLPDPTVVISTIKHRLKRAIMPDVFWEELGFTYLGPVDGHNIPELESALTHARDYQSRPVLVHVLTQKGKGYPQAETDVVRYHGISPSNGVKVQAPSYSQVFATTLLSIMRENKKVVAITAAMLDGTGLNIVAREFPERVFDVGICEQHAVTMAAGMAKQGLAPVVAIYSTFLQRAYDQIVHDVCLPNMPVVFAVDRAGIVGEDGKTHQGPFDISFLRCIPNMALASPADEDELRHLIFSAVGYKVPIAIRYPRGNGEKVSLSAQLKELPIGKAEVLREGGDLTILAIGPAVHRALEAAGALAKDGVDCTVINARFAKPLDTGLIMQQAGKTGKLLTIEENALCGGFGSAVMEALGNAGASHVRLERLGLPDRFIEHGPQELFRSQLNIDAEGIARYVRACFPELLLKVTAKKTAKP